MAEQKFLTCPICNQECNPASINPNHYVFVSFAGEGGFFHRDCFLNARSTKEILELVE